MYDKQTDRHSVYCRELDTNEFFFVSVYLMVFIDCVWYVSNCWVIVMNIGKRETK